jgi:hypothetical protein
MRSTLFAMTGLLVLLSSACFAITGSGISSDPWIIANRADFDTIVAGSSYWDGFIRMDVDIDLTGTVYSAVPIAPDTNSSESGFQGTEFTGNFNGNGHKIKRLNIWVADHDAEGIALFGRIGWDGIVENLGIENCWIEGEHDSRFVAAMCGVNMGTIRSCYSTGTIKYGNNMVGGLCGWSTGIIENSFSLAEVIGSGSYGGLCGWITTGSEITNCWSAGEVRFGRGLIGRNDGGTVTNCFWNTKTSLCDISNGGTGKITEEMRIQGTFTGWDFTTKWKMSHASGSYNGYPIPAWLTDNPNYSLAGSGTTTDPFIIASRANFDVFRADPNYWNDCIRLDADINLSGTTYTMAPIAPDTVIGTLIGDVEDFEGTAFSGYFNGNGHTISGLTISGGNNNYIGLFGYIHTGEVENLKLTSCNVSGNDLFIGVLVGKADYAEIINCSVAGSIVSGGTTGKFVGGMCGANKSAHITFQNCSAVATVSGFVYVGGMFGEAGASGVGDVNSCYAGGTVSGYSTIGGLAGGNESIMSDCYSDAAVTGDRAIGGLCGHNFGTIKSSYATGNVTGGTYRIGGFCGANQRFITDCFSTGTVSGGPNGIGGFCGDNWNASITNSYCTGVVTPTPGTEAVGGFCGINSTADGFLGYIINCFYNTDTSQMTWGYSDYFHHGDEPGICVGLTTAQMRLSTPFTTAGWDFVGETINGTEDIWKMPEYDANNGFPIFPWYNEVLLAGSGTLADPYIIDTRSKFDYYVDNPTLWSTCVKLGCNIDLSDTTYNRAPISPDTNDSLVGFQGTKFTGQFDGNKYRINNLTVTGGTNDYIGLFGYIDASGKVINLQVRKAHVSGYDYVGGLCGYNTGTIEKCSSGGTVTGGYMTGGLAGYSDNIIRISSSNCDVNGSEFIGGLVGANEYYGNIQNSYASGNCYASESPAGGFVGQNIGEISKCYASGDIDAPNQADGAFCGYDDGAITGCYYDRANGTDAYAIRISAAQFAVQSTFGNLPYVWDFAGSKTDGSHDYWKMAFWVNRGHPILNWQIDFPDIADHWLQDYYPCDFNDDHIVNFIDFAELGQ